MIPFLKGFADGAVAVIVIVCVCVMVRYVLDAWRNESL